MDGSGLIRVALVLAALSLMVGGFVLAYRDEAAAAAVTYVAAVFCLVFAFLSQFKKFSGLGFSGETWEKKMEEADELINRLRGLATAVAEPVFIAMGRLGRWDSHLSRQERYDIASKLQAALSNNGVPVDEIERVRSELDRVNTFDMALPLFNKVYRKLQEKVDERRKIMDAFRQPITEHEEHTKAVVAWREATDQQRIFSPTRIEPYSSTSKIFSERLEACSLLTPEERAALRDELKEEIADLEYYVQHRQFRRLDVWLKGED